MRKEGKYSADQVSLSLLRAKCGKKKNTNKQWLQNFNKEMKAKAEENEMKEKAKGDGLMEEDRAQLSESPSGVKSGVSILLGGGSPSIPHGIHPGVESRNELKVLKMSQGQVRKMTNSIEIYF